MILASKFLSAAVNTEIFRVDQTRRIKNITWADKSGSDQNMRLWVIPHDKLLADKYIWIYDRQLPANSTLLFPMNDLTLLLGDSIWAYCSGGSLAVNVTD